VSPSSPSGGLDATSNRGQGLNMVISTELYTRGIVKQWIFL